MQRQPRILVFLLLTVLLLGQTVGGVSAQDPTTPAIGTIEINQGIGVQLNNHLNFVAGKDTVVRAFMTAEVTVDPAQSGATVTRDGSVVATLQPKAYDKPTTVVDFPCPSREACGNWAAGSYVFELKVNGVTKSTEGTAYNFVERGLVRVLAMAVKAIYSGEVKTIAEMMPDNPEKWKKDGLYTQVVYPLKPENYKWIIRDEFDASAAKYDLNTNEGRYNLWKALSDLNPNECAADPKKDGCYDLVVGFIPTNPRNTKPDGSVSTLAGFTYGKPGNIVVAKDQDSEATVAHEIAHVYGVGDTYDGGTLHCIVNQAPTGFKGTDWDTQSETTCVPGVAAYPNVSASLIPASDHAYEIGGRGSLGNMACYMGSGGEQKQFWTSAAAYDWLFTKLAPTPAIGMAAPSVRLVSAAGSIYDTGEVDVYPWVTLTGPAPAPLASPYKIEAVDGSSTVLASQGIDVEFIPHNVPKGEKVEPINPAPFESAVPFPAGTTAFRIISGTQVLQVIPVSANAPVVTITTPTAGQNLTGAYTIRWQATDTDNDPLFYTVEYAPDGVNWDILIGDITETSWDDDFSLLPGGNAARIRVTATDGINSGQATSAQFTVPIKAPEVFIDEPMAGHYNYGDEVTLSGAAYDVQDDWLADARLTWRSDRQGVLGEGGLLYVENLEPGTHVITLAATNSFNQTSVATATITIGHPLLPAETRKPGRPGATVTYTLRLTNTATVADTFDLVTFSEWPMTVTPTEVTLAPATGVNVAVAVTIPITAVKGLSDEAYVVAASRTFTETATGDPLLAASLLVTNVEFRQIYLPTLLKRR